MKLLLSLFAFILCVQLVGAQTALEVTDQKIKIGSFKEETLYLAFAEGDKLLFNFLEMDGKELKEIEILEYPSASKFSDFKTSKIEGKVLSVSKTAVYIFRFKNSSVSGRICRIQIQRIPASEQTKDFNTAVNWVDKTDTSWNNYTRNVIVGYDTSYLKKTGRVLVKSEQKEETIIEKNERVHSVSSRTSNKTHISFSLPANILSGNNTKSVVAWAFWVGVGEESTKAWNRNVQLIAGIVQTTAGLFTSPLGAFALGKIAELALPSMGEDIRYNLTDKENHQFYVQKLKYKTFEQGKGIAGYTKFDQPSLSQGNFYIHLENDNLLQGLNVSVKVIAIIETKEFANKTFTETVLKPRYEKKSFRDALITIRKVPVIKTF